MTNRPSWTLAAFMTLAAAAPVHAFCTEPAPEQPVFYYEVLLDLDQNLGTGGPVTVRQGAEAPHDELGIEARVVSWAEGPMRGAPAGLQIIATTVETWNGAAFVRTYCDDTDYELTDPAPGVPGFTEWQVPLTALGSPTSVARALFHVSTLTQFNDYTTSFLINFGGVVTVPTLASPALLLLALLLLLAGGQALRRHRLLTTAALLLLATTTAWAAAGFTMDGDNTDWASVPVAVNDPPGDSSLPSPYEDMLGTYADVRSGYLSLATVLAAEDAPRR